MKNGLIAYTARDSSGHQNIFLIALDGTGKVQRTGGSDNALPSWSPDGKRLTYVSRQPRTGLSFVCVMHADGSGQTSLVAGTTPAWSPDGRSIAYAGYMDGAAAIYAMDPSGAHLGQLTRSDGVQRFHPTWSPDGKHLAYAQWDPATSRGAIWTLEVATGKAKPITRGTWNNLDAKGHVINTANDANSPTWGGTKIAYWSGIEHELGQIWVSNEDGSGRTQLTHSAGSNDDPEFSPDNELILFSTNRSGHPELWVMATDGSGQDRITDSWIGPLPGDAAWQPIP